ncbi:tripartite tricarboxylate transporter TctB family protein [Rubellimicrobium rubrum]|uniref:Tripartite tricarboxylate transporter TctB family protein n=1 Tax=Rubellimicrobium rubrum TaxID=2585369 RepID=A0A5C4MMR7_9RHOB|nr:tripartite tricarboxylate transporter TctB family protein [Rubellimicrobium rubrum]TNC44600.1 tripartite tricarboxylate transporter TctB family protein [Rubellimicrobium rubrum]
MSTDRTLGGLALLMALVIAGFGWGLVAPFAYEPVGPSAFPLVTAALIGGCGLVLLLRGTGRAEPGVPGAGRGVLILSATLLAYAVLFQPLGFVLSTAAMSLVTARVFGATWAQGLVVGSILALGSFLLFDHGLDVVLPTGVLGELL